MSLFRRSLEERLRRADLKLQDAEHNLRKWGWSNTPSEDDAERKRIDKLRAKYEALRDEFDAAGSES